MDLIDVMDAIKVHAAASALSLDAKWKDVAVGHPMPRGRCVRIFYAGEAPPEHMPGERTLSSQMIGDRVMLRAFWPVAEYAAKRGRVLMSEMARFVTDLRTRVLGDSQLGGEAVDLNMHPADADDTVIGGVLFAIVDIEFVVDFREITIAK